MLRKSPAVLMTILLTLACVSTALAFGEDILAATGQYTFFIKPEPGSGVTYYQRMVPCVADVPVCVPRREAPVYPLPMAAIERQKVLVRETPVGCALGEGECVECFPKSLRYRGIREGVGPRDIPVRIPDLRVERKIVKRPVMRPQWFAVTEDPLPPQPVRKVHPGR